MNIYDMKRMSLKELKGLMIGGIIMIILNDLLDKFNVDYANFPEGILGIEFNQELDDIDTFTHEIDDVYIFKGDYVFKQLKDRDLIAEVEVKVDLRNLPSKKKIMIVEDIFNSSDEINPEKYGLSIEEICFLEIEVFSKRPVSLYRRVKGNVFANYYEYNILGGQEAHS